MIEIRQLNTFLQLAAVLNFTQTGKNLGYSQSNISMHIQRLEEEIGAPLFNRIGGHVSLTQYGEELLPYAREIVNTSLKMETFLKSDESLGGTLRFGIVESLFSLTIEQTMLKYHERFPKVNIELTVNSTSALKEYIYQGAIDAACIIDDSLPPAQWNCWYKKAVPIVIAAGNSHPLAARKSLALENLKNEEFVLMEDSASYSALFQSRMADLRIDLKTFLTLQNADMACRLLKSGNFLSVVPQYTVLNHTNRNDLSVLPVKDFSHTQFVQVVLHPGKAMIPQIEGFLEELGAVIKSVI